MSVENGFGKDTARPAPSLLVHPSRLGGYTGYISDTPDGCLKTQVSNWDNDDRDSSAIRLPFNDVTCVARC